ncbi:response regulator [Streptomyces kunmingensis]|uniref:Response regulator n=1 Tax=Streptomyces kunmingensis TaxID=68225 RepID=A0ABU6C4V4_9ACTN|nr:response regulator [Streptomyces kunmingensis]MEB3959241.1 response regulator [Streptomyces kunmingensis]
MCINIVVVDDDPGFRRIAIALLTARGLRVVAECGDGASALDEVRTHRPDGVLLDLHLPGLDGVALARLLRACVTPPAGRAASGTPRIVLTSTDESPWSHEQLADAGIDAFVAKDRLVDADLRGLFTPAAP